MKTIAAIALGCSLLMISPAQGEGRGAWVAIHQDKYVSGEIAATAYINLSMIIRDSGNPRVWVLLDRKQRAATGHMSSLNLTEVDCAGRRARSLHIRTYSGAMATGSTVADAVPPEMWDSAYFPSSCVYDLSKHVC